MLATRCHLPIQHVGARTDGSDAVSVLHIIIPTSPRPDSSRPGRCNEQTLLSEEGFFLLHFFYSVTRVRRRRRLEGEGEEEGGLEWFDGNFVVRPADSQRSADLRRRMGQAFRKLFDAFFGNSEMRVRRSSLLDSFDAPLRTARVVSCWFFFFGSFNCFRWGDARFSGRDAWAGCSGQDHHPVQAAHRGGPLDCPYDW